MLVRSAASTERSAQRTFKIRSLTSVTLSGCTQYLVVLRMKLPWEPPAALSPLTGWPRVRTMSYSFDSLTMSAS